MSTRPQKAVPMESSPPAALLGGAITDSAPCGVCVRRMCLQVRLLSHGSSSLPYPPSPTFSPLPSSQSPLHFSFEVSYFSLSFYNLYKISYSSKNSPLLNTGLPKRTQSWKIISTCVRESFIFNWIQSKGKNKRTRVRLTNCNECSPL